MTTRHQHKTQFKMCPFHKTMFVIIIILFTLGFVGVLVGSFVDLNFSKALAGHTNDSNYFNDHTSRNTVFYTFWWVFSGFAGYIFTILITYAVSALITLNGFWRKWHISMKCVYWFLSCIFAFVCLWWQTYDGFIAQIYESFNINGKASYLIFPKEGQLNYDYLWESAITIIVLFGGCLLFNLFYVRKRSISSTVCKWSFFSTVSIIFASLIVFILKAWLHRERYFQLVTTGNLNNFKNWYSLIWNMNIDDDPIKTSAMTSFPSGHTTWAMGVITLIPLFYFLCKKPSTFILFTSIFISFVIVIMFCRIASGRHYLSDVSMAVIINLACFVSIGYFVFQYPKK